MVGAIVLRGFLRLSTELTSYFFIEKSAIVSFKSIPVPSATTHEPKKWLMVLVTDTTLPLSSPIE